MSNSLHEDCVKTPTGCLPMGSLIARLQAGMDIYEALDGRRPDDFGAHVRECPHFAKGDKEYSKREGA